MLAAMPLPLIIRTATPADLAAVDLLLARSYPRLLAADYPPSVMVMALPIISRARPDLLASGRYYLAFDGAGQLLGAGGWSGTAPGPSDKAAFEVAKPQAGGVGHVRHLATDPDALRQGVGRAVMATVFAAAGAAGVNRMECLATLTAVPFYKAAGFAVLAAVEVPLRPGIVSPAVQMIRTLP